MTPTTTKSSLLSKIAGGFRSLKDCSPELWAINAVKVRRGGEKKRRRGREGKKRGRPLASPASRPSIL
jgi:hypothetical protein